MPYTGDDFVNQAIEEVQKQAQSARFARLYDGRLCRFTGFGPTGLVRITEISGAFGQSFTSSAIHLCKVAEFIP